MATERMTGTNGWNEPFSTSDWARGNWISSSEDDSVLASDISRALARQSKLLELPLFGAHLFLYEQRSQQIQELLVGVRERKLQRPACHRLAAEITNSEAVLRGMTRPGLPLRTAKSEPREFWLLRFLKCVFVTMYEAIASLNPLSWRSSRSGDCDQAIPLNF